MTPLQEIGQAIHEVCESLDTLDDVIRQMPAFKRHTPFGQDRLAEKQRLQHQLDRLHAEQDRLPAENPAAEMHPVGRIPERFLATE
jgi:hypothetical protein